MLGRPERQESFETQAQKDKKVFAIAAHGRYY